MKRNPSPKQRFIKDYAKLIYGPTAKSNALTRRDRNLIAQLFKDYAQHHHLLVQYPRWLSDNWLAVQSHIDNPSFYSDSSKPGRYLFSHHFVSWFLNSYVATNRALPRLGTRRPPARPPRPALNPQVNLAEYLTRVGLKLG